MRLGAAYLGDERTAFHVWASKADRVELLLYAGEGSDEPERTIDMAPIERGYYAAVAEGAGHATRYRFRLPTGRERPDPASRHQPEGLHGPSAVVDTAFPWTDTSWHGRPLQDFIVYELHVGTFTPDGTFDSAIDQLDQLVDLGVTAIEVMPIAEFPGGRNWGYDGALPFAAQSTYGGPDGFRRFVTACHLRGLAVVLDVVYNHLGPEGAYLSDYAHYFTERYSTPWGPAVNFDGPHSDEVRRYVIENALYWVTDCHVDALRLDAVHAIFDQSARHILEELVSAVHERARQLNRQIHIIAESDLNDPRLVRLPEVGGYGLDGHWVDDFHHAVHAVLTGERVGYYADYGGVADVARALKHAYVYTGQTSVHRGHRHGAPPLGIPAERFVVCVQNHDQVGNRMNGERLSALVPFEPLKIAATVLLLAPFVPLLFMGEEYGEPAPFLYFVSHSDPQLVEAVRRGRKAEFAAFAWAGEPPDPQAEETFLVSKLDHDLRGEGRHAALLAYYRRLIALRRTVPAFARLDRDCLEVAFDDHRELLVWRRWWEAHDERSDVLVVCNLGDLAEAWRLHLPVGSWGKILDSGDDAWGGPGAAAPAAVQSEGEAVLSVPPRTAVVYLRGVQGWRLHAS
ncbi:MAG: malto-oligosyltrehalose trehalohydrolase [Nitriliruptorales bacterium]